MKRKKNVKKFKDPFKEPLNLTITPKTQYIFCAYWKKKKKNTDEKNPNHFSRLESLMSIQKI